MSHAFAENGAPGDEHAWPLLTIMLGARHWKNGQSRANDDADAILVYRLGR